MFNKECQIMVLDYHRMQVRKQNLIDMINNKMKDLRESMKGSNIGKKRADHYLGQLKAAQINTELFKALPLRDMAESIQSITQPDLQVGYDDDERHSDIRSSMRDELDKQTLGSTISSEDETSFIDQLKIKKGKKEVDSSESLPDDILESRIRDMTRANSVNFRLDQLHDNKFTDSSSKALSGSTQPVPEDVKRKQSKEENRQKKWKKANSNLRAVMQINAFTNIAQTIARSAKDEAAARVNELAASRRKISEINFEYTQATKKAAITDSKLMVEIEKEIDDNEKNERALITSKMWKQQAFANLALEENVLKHIEQKMKIETAEKKKLDWLIERLLYRYPADLMATENSITKFEDAVLKLTKKLKAFEVLKKRAKSVEERNKNQVKEKEIKNTIQAKEELIEEKSKKLEALRDVYFRERQNEMHVEIDENKATIQSMDDAIQECNDTLAEAMERHEALQKQKKKVKVLETQKRTKQFTEAKFQIFKAKLVTDLEEIEVEIQEYHTVIKDKLAERFTLQDYTDKMQMVLDNYSMSNLPELRDCTRRKQLTIAHLASAIKDQNVKIRTLQHKLKVGKKASLPFIHQQTVESASSSLMSNVSDTWIENIMAGQLSPKSSKLSDLTGLTDMFGGNLQSESSSTQSSDPLSTPALSSPIFTAKESDHNRKSKENKRKSMGYEKRLTVVKSTPKSRRSSFVQENKEARTTRTLKKEKKNQHQEQVKPDVEDVANKAQSKHKFRRAFRSASTQITKSRAVVDKLRRTASDTTTYREKDSESESKSESESESEPESEPESESESEYSDYDSSETNSYSTNYSTRSSMSTITDQKGITGHNSDQEGDDYEEDPTLTLSENEARKEELLKQREQNSKGERQKRREEKDRSERGKKMWLTALDGNTRERSGHQSKQGKKMLIGDEDGNGKLHTRHHSKNGKKMWIEDEDGNEREHTGHQPKHGKKMWIEDEDGNGKLHTRHHSKDGKKMWIEAVKDTRKERREHHSKQGKKMMIEDEDGNEREHTKHQSKREKKMWIEDEDDDERELTRHISKRGKKTLMEDKYDNKIKKTKHHSKRGKKKLMEDEDDDEFPMGGKYNGGDYDNDNDDDGEEVEHRVRKIKPEKREHKKKMTKHQRSKHGQRKDSVVEERDSLTGEIVSISQKTGELKKHRKSTKPRYPGEGHLDGTTTTEQDEDLPEEEGESSDYDNWYSKTSVSETEEDDESETTEQSKQQNLSKFVVNCTWSLESPFNLVCRHPVLGVIRTKHPRPHQLADKPGYWGEQDFKKEVFYDGELYSDTSMVWQPKPNKISVASKVISVAAKAKGKRQTLH